MNPVNFQIVPGSDKEYVDAFERMRTEGVFVFEKATLGQFNEMPAAELQKNQGLQEVLAQGVRVFPNLSFQFQGKYEDAVLRAVNLGDDADTTGAICGQLAGAYWGESGISESLRSGLARMDMLENALAGTIGQ